MQFVHRISKGSRFNQIYVPASMNEVFEVGDLVEVRLIEKKTKIYTSCNIQLSAFKKKLINQILSILQRITGIEQSFIVGSFLTSKTDYNDIDILLISNKDCEKEVYSRLMTKFDLKFHVLVIPEERFQRLIKICPLTRSMLYYFVSHKHFSLPATTEIDKQHLEFLLMMPEDLLEIKANSRAYYDSWRRLLAIERFLKGEAIDNIAIIKDIERSLGKLLHTYMRSNEPLEEIHLKKIRTHMDQKIHFIRKLLRAS
ncbi:MAG: hypothetical protein AABX86_00785 [Nanoarchaeota archaeon]